MACEPLLGNDPDSGFAGRPSATQAAAWEEGDVDFEDAFVGLKICVVLDLLQECDHP